MVRASVKLKGLGRRNRRKGGSSYEKMMKTLLLQNQQIIIQQQNMMFMVMKHYQPQPTSQPTANIEPISSQSSNAQTNLHQEKLQENQCNYLTPAASEQDDLAALLEGDGLLHNNFLYNPQTDIGSITPYKSHQDTPSGYESLTTPRVEYQRQPTTTNISQNVVKNLADSFKSPTKPKINVQILSDSTTGSMKNSKAKIIQRMNISEFLRHVHPEVMP